MIEPRAIVVRMAQSWVRIGSFDIHRSRGDREMSRKLADYCINEVFGGVDKLIAAKAGQEKENRFLRFYREVVKRCV